VTHKILKISGMAIAAINVVNVINSTWFFLGMAHFPAEAWLVFNACAPSVMLYLAGYFFKSSRIMASALPFLLFFGTGGLFVFGWTGTAIYAQIGHIAMTLATVWILMKIFMEKSYRFSVAGLAAGIIAFAVVLPVQQKYVKTHPEYLKKLGDSTFEEFIKKKG